jgi:Flp pilus assembly CpaF family ATPase
VLRALLDARLSFLVSGGTGTGNPNNALRHL